MQRPTAGKLWIEGEDTGIDHLELWVNRDAGPRDEMLSQSVCARWLCRLVQTSGRARGPRTDQTAVDKEREETRKRRTLTVNEIPEGSPTARHSITNVEIASAPAAVNDSVVDLVRQPRTLPDA